MCAGDRVRDADWAGIANGADFEDKYIEVSKRGVSLKGESWGRALARYAMEYPNLPNGEERPFVKQIRGALLARRVSYDLQRQTYRFDPDTFEPVAR